MVNSTSITCQMKREILNFSNKISRHLPKPDRKFIADMACGMPASGSSINDIAFSAMERGAILLGKATFALDRGCGDNKMFLKLDSLKQNDVIRLTAKRKLYFHGRGIPAT